MTSDVETIATTAKHETTEADSSNTDIAVVGSASTSDVDGNLPTSTTTTVIASTTTTTTTQEVQQEAREDENSLAVITSTSSPSSSSAVVATTTNGSPTTTTSNTRDTASSVFGGLSFLVNTAKVITEVSFAGAKFGAHVGLSVARGIVNGIGEVTGLDEVGVTPLVSNTLHLAEKLAHFGIDTGRFWTRFGLNSANLSLGTLDHIFGSTDTARAISEFAKLVNREFARAIEIGDLDDSRNDALAIEWFPVDADEADGTLTVSGGGSPSNNTSLQEIGFFDTVRAIAAWYSLQRLTRSQWRTKALQGCGPAILLVPSHASPDTTPETVAQIVELDDSVDINLEDIVFEAVVDSNSNQSSEIVLAHIGQAGMEQPGWLDDDGTPSMVQKMRRYMRFASGAYGQAAVRFLFGGDPITLGDILADSDSSSGSVHRNHKFYAEHTNVEAQDVVHTSYHNRQRPAVLGPQTAPFALLQGLLPDNNSHYQPTFYVIIDHAHRTLVLAIRGTLSLHDAMVDLTCESDRVNIDGKDYLVHEGMHRAALRIGLPAEEWSREVASLPTEVSSMPNFRTQAKAPMVFEAVRAGLLAHEGYSLALTGHSLGAGIASLLALLWGDAATGTISARSGLPGAGVTRIHCYAYATPAVLAVAPERPATATTAADGETVVTSTPPAAAAADASASTPSTSKVAAGFEKLVTSVLLGDDMVPRLSLGSVRDLAATIAWMHSRRDNVAGSLLKALLTGDSSPSIKDDVGNEVELVALRERLERKYFVNEQLYPVGRLFWLATTPDADAGTRSSDPLEMLFMREVHDPTCGILNGLDFTSNMVHDHLPNAYGCFIEEK